MWVLFDQMWVLCVVAVAYWLKSKEPPSSPFVICLSVSYGMQKKKKGRDIFSSGSAPVTLYEADIGFVKAVFELHRACFISFLLWCFVVLTQWLLFSNNNSSIPSTTLLCQELSMPTRPSQILQQTTNTQSSLWEKKGSSAVCGVIKTDLILGSLLRTGNGNMKVNYFNCPCVTDTIYYYIWKKKNRFFL